MANTGKKAAAGGRRWESDSGKGKERLKPEEYKTPAGAVFFRAVEDYNQEQASEALTDLNLKLIAQANPAPGEWAYLPLVQERSPAKEIEKIKRALSLPSNARAVLVDSGLSVRAVITGTPINERILEFNFIEEASFDCWVHGEWVCEEVFAGKNELLRRATALLHRYLVKDMVDDENFLDAPRPEGALPPARTEW